MSSTAWRAKVGALSRVGALFTVGVGVVACAPALNWREARMAGADFRASFPCRPDHHERKVPLDGQALLMRMASCSAEGWQFAVTQVEVGDPARVNDVMRSLYAAAQGKLVAAQSANLPGSMWHWPGATPYQGAGRWSWTGRGSDDRPLALEVAIAAYGGVVVQALVVGPQLGGAELAPFWDGLGRVAP